MAAPQRREPGSAHLAPEEAGLFHGIVEQLGGAALLCDRDGTVRWANSRASEWLGATACCGTAQLDALSLPWPLDATQLAAACDGATQRLRPAMLDCADGVARRCHARLAPLRRGAQPALALLWIDEQPDDDGGAPSETQRRRALAAAQVGSWNRNLEAGAARVDPLWCHALGLDPCEGPAHLELWARRIHPDDVERFRRAAEELACAAEGAPDFDVEYRILTVDSRWLWVLQRGRVTRRARDGRPLHAAGICIDIDARKRAEVEVHENESRLATALWGAQAAFWQLHVPSDTATRSPLWFAMTGYSREAWDAVPQPWMSRLHPDDRPEVERRIAEHIAGRSQSLELRYRMKCADGAWKWMMDRGRVVEWDFDGRAIRAIGVSLDIDAQRRAELELHSSEARLETAVWGAGVGLYELDCPSGVTRWLNDWCERFDIDPCAGAEHVDRWDSNIHPDDLPAARARFSGHLAGSEEYYDAEYRIRTRGGAWRWIYERGRVTERDAAGAPLRLVGTCLDIDARRRVELAADESRRRLELALEGARGCLWEWDIARDEYSDAYYELHGVDPEAGRRNRNFWNECAHPDDRERVLAAERELIEGRIESFDTQYRIRHADGSWRWLVDRYRAGERDASGRATRLIGVAIDVTEEVQVRAALEASESSLRAIAQNAPDWMFLLGRDLRIRFANREVPGRSVAGLVGCAALDVVDPQWREVFRGHFEAVLQDGEPVSFDQLRPAPDGSTVVYLHRVNAVRDARGAIEGLAVMVTDVTAQRDAQLALQRSERLLRTVTANSNDWLVLLDHEHRLRFVNRPVGTQSVSRLLGRSALDIVEPESVPAMRAALDAVLANGQPRVVMQRLPATALHGPRHLEVWVTAAFDGAAITGTVLTVSDVTERVRQQQALLTQAQVLETMAEAVLLVDVNDVAKLVNPAFEALACRKRDDLVGRSLTTLLRECVPDARDLVAAAQLHWRTQPPRVPLRREFDWQSPDGRVLRVGAVFTRLEVDGAPHVLCVYSNLTEQRQVERQIIDAVQRAQRRIGADLHDGLGQELTGIAMMLRSLQSDAADGARVGESQIEEVVALINASIETARTMARGLAPIDPEHGGLVGALQRLADSSSRQSGVRVELRNRVPPGVVFSPEESTHLFRIAQEAVSNALRHADPRTVQVALDLEGGFATLSVRDDGRGFPDGSEPERGLGLKTMRFRASMLRGDLDIVRNAARGRPEPGITLLCRVPVHSRRPASTAVAPQESPRT